MKEYNFLNDAKKASNYSYKNLVENLFKLTSKNAHNSMIVSSIYCKKH